MSEPPENQWHLDKRVPIALIFAIFVQTAGVVWFLSDLSSRVGALEQRTALVEEFPVLVNRVNAHDARLDASRTRIERNESAISLVNSNLGEIKGQLKFIADLLAEARQEARQRNGGK